MSGDYINAVGKMGDMLHWYCWTCREKVMPIWELTSKGKRLELELDEASKERGEKRQVPESLYWKESNGNVTFAYCSPECSLKDHEKG